MTLARRGALPLLIACCVCGTIPAPAAPKTPQPATNTPAIPAILVIQPLHATPGSTVQLLLRGQHLTNVTAITLGHGQPPIEATLRQKKKLETGKSADAAKLGDSQIEISVRIPEDTLPGTNKISVTSPAGTSAAIPWILLAAPGPTQEQEPNGGFAQAQALALDRTLAGAIQEAADVDVYRWTGRRGQQVEFRIWAAQGASALDPVLTLLDAQGRVMAMADDSGGTRDPVLRTTLPNDGDYLLSVVDAYERGGPGYSYLLSARVIR